MALFRVFRGFLGGFMGFVWVCVVLVLCVACVGFCVREVFGGFKACGVFAPVFILLPFSFCLSFYLFAPAFCPFVLLCSGCLSLSSCIVFVVSFSLSDYTQKERARRVGASSLRVS